MYGIDDTGPLTPPELAQPEPVRSRRWLVWFAGIVLLGMTVLAGGALSGYAAGLSARDQRELGERGLVSQEQFDLGVQDLLEGRYELARQRFAYVLEIEPENTVARELLGEALIALDQPTPTPSLTPSPTLDISPTPTLDLNSMDGLFASAQAAHGQGDWDSAAEILVTLMAEAPDFRPAEVDQLLFSVLRNRGLEKIWAGDQEQGIYDLTLAERLFALDNQAASWRRSAAFYLFANSYFGLDWEKATQNFSQICTAGIWDGCYKYARSAWEYGKKLMEAEDPCAAVVQYDASLRTRDDAGNAPTATEAFDICLTATAPAPTATITPTLDLTITVIPTATVAGPTLTPTFTGTPGPTASPTETSTPTPTATPTPTETAG